MLSCSCVVPADQLPLLLGLLPVRVLCNQVLTNLTTYGRFSLYVIFAVLADVPSAAMWRGLLRQRGLGFGLSVRNRLPTIVPYLILRFAFVY